MVTAGDGSTALVAPPPVLLAIVMLALHFGDDASPICTLVHKGLIKVVDISSPSARVKLMFRRQTLKSPNPVLMSVVVNALNVVDVVARRTLKVQLAIVIISPVYLTQTAC